MSEAGGIEAVCIYGPPPCGRRPDGLGAARVEQTNELADFLARAAHLEAASISAFERLASELDRLGAPSDLAERARAAASDERRHARAMGRHARTRGAVVPRVRASAERERSLFDIALENATEGCVREAYGALFAVWQSEHAADADLRRTMKAIARDEAAHAELARDVHRWARAELGARERAELDAAMHDAWTELEEEVANARPSTRLARELGVPRTKVAVTLVRKLQIALS
jgi:hypothetical protein